MALIRLFNGKDLQKLIDKKIVSPDTHIIVVRFNTFYFVPIVTSRHRHYIILKANRSEGVDLFKNLAKQGFTLVKGSLRFLIER
ncbi:MAG: hypothetical protein DRN04_15900 [Thermoprotei archaeon]|nr:MAG: hypothetical protein DRN04_15900 [Thermoprotei archaeon]